MSGTSEKIAALNEAGFTPEPPPDEWGEPVPFDTIPRLVGVLRSKRKADDMDRPLELLAEYGYVRRMESEIGYNNRRQVGYKINPRCLWK